MGHLTPPRSKSFPGAELELDPHTSVTVAPPSATTALAERLRRAAPSSYQADLALPVLDAKALGGVSLSELAKLINDLFVSLDEVGQARERLEREVGGLRGQLRSIEKEKEELARRATELAGALSAAQMEHDQFLVGLLEEHEEERLALGSGAGAGSRRELELAFNRAEAEREQAETACFALQSELSRAHEALSLAEEARDEARARADKRERERDELRAEASRLRAQLGANAEHTNAERPSAAPSLLPPPGRPAGSVPPAALSLDDGELDSSLHVTPRLPSVAPRWGAALPLGRLRPPSSSPADATPFPHETTRPGVGAQHLPALPVFGPPPSGWTPMPPPAEAPRAPVHGQSAANLPQTRLDHTPPLKQKPDPATRPLVDYSLGEGGVQSELLEGARLSSTPPRK